MIMILTRIEPLKVQGVEFSCCNHFWGGDSPEHFLGTVISGAYSTANLRTNIMDFRGFDSGII